MSETSKPVLAGLAAHWLGRIPFTDAVQRNDLAVAQARASGVGQVLLFEPAAAVLTLGRRSQSPTGRAELTETIALCAARGIAVVDADRGGLATLHAPGQLVVFVALPPPTPPIPALVCELLRAARCAAGDIGAAAAIRAGADAGLWLGPAKLGSVGLRIRDRCVLHGLSLNVALDSQLAAGLVLCGHGAAPFASMGEHSHDQRVRAAVREASVRFVEASRMRACA